MKDLVRQNNMQYAGNFSNTLVTKSGCKGTSNNRAAAAGVYQAGGDGSAGDRGYSTSIADGSGALDSPMRTYEGYGDSAGSMRTMAQERGGNNFPVFSKSIASLSGGRKPKTKKRGKKFYKGSRSKTMPGKEDFTTKKKSKMYNEKRFKRLFGRRTGRAPIFSYIGGRGAKGFSHPKKGQMSRTRKGRQDFTTKRGNKYFDRKGRRSRHARGSKKKRNPYMKGGKALAFSDVPQGNANNPAIARAHSNYYAMGSNPGPGGRLANPIPYKSKPLCPLKGN